MATRTCDVCKHSMFRTAKCGSCCAEELLKQKREWEQSKTELVSEMTSRSASTIETLQAQSRLQVEELKAQSRLQVEELKAQSRLQIEELEAQSRLQIDNLQSRLNFLRLRFDDDQADRDVIIVIGDDGYSEYLYCHKVVSASRSPVFCKMFEPEKPKRNTAVIRIKDATFPVMRAVIKFCYTAEINFDEEVTLEEVLEVAHKYAVGAIFKICEDHLAKSIDNVNLPRMLKVAKRFGAKSLQAAASEYFKKHFDELIGSVVDEGFSS